MGHTVAGGVGTTSTTTATTETATTTAPQQLGRLAIDCNGPASEGVGRTVVGKEARNLSCGRASFSWIVGNGCRRAK